MRVLKQIAVAACIVIILLVLIYIWVFKSAGTNVTFQSSDKQWADSEILFKGRNFQSIVFYFHLYKIKCNRPNVKLERLTEKPEWYTLENLFNNYEDPKWKIPLGVGNKNTISGYYPDVTANHCYNGSASMEALNMAESQSKAFMARLRKTHNTALHLTAPDGATGELER